MGIFCIVSGMFVILLNDVIIKWISGDYPIHQIVLIRSLIAIPITLLIVRFDGGWQGLKTKRPLLHLARGLLIVVANMCYFLGLAAMPLADAMALFFIAPLLITALSVPMLGEQVGWRRWLAVAVGMVGVLVMLRPAGGVIQLAAILPVIAAMAYALMQMLTRRLGTTDRASVMALYIQLTFVFVSSAIGLAIGDGRFAGGDNASLDFLLRAWHWPTAADAVAMAICGCCIGIGGYLLSQAYRLGQASVIAPFEYTALPWGVFTRIFSLGRYSRSNDCYWNFSRCRQRPLCAFTGKICTVSAVRLDLPVAVCADDITLSIIVFTMQIGFNQFPITFCHRSWGK